MDEDSNPLIHLPKMIRFQLMLYLSIMWCFIFSVWTGWMVLFGPSIFIHVVILIGTDHKDGIYQVRDTMNARFVNYIDILESPGVKPYKFNKAKIIKTDILDILTENNS